MSMEISMDICCKDIHGNMTEQLHPTLIFVCFCSSSRIVEADMLDNLIYLVFHIKQDKRADILESL